MAHAPELAAQTTYTVQEWYDLGFTCAIAQMVVFGDPNDRFHHIWEAAATASSLFQTMVHLCRNDQLPRIFIEKRDDRFLDFLGGNEIAVADKHSHTHGWAVLIHGRARHSQDRPA